MTTRMWKVDGEHLVSLESSGLEEEARLERWIEADPSVLGLDLLIIGSQVRTEHGGFIDLLGIDADGDLTILELKRDRTAREVVAQVLDYASWVRGLPTRRVHEIAGDYFAGRNVLKRLSEVFKERFGRALPETLNSTHSMMVIASELDEASKRIIEYLAEQHGLDINTAFFKFHRDDGQEYLSADWLMDQVEVRERSEAKTKAPWTGVWYVNVGDGESRSWEDARKYGFIAAGGGPRYSDPLKHLAVGDRLYAYQSGHGYVGSGTVTATAKKAKDFLVDGKPILALPLKQAGLGHDQDDDERAEYVVGVRWDRSFPLADAKWFEGGFANQNIVCKLRDEATLQFLNEQFRS